MLSRTQRMENRIDSRSSVSPKAQLGRDVSVGPFSLIEDDVVIGDGTWIGSNVVVHNGARIGKRCEVFSGAAIAGPPQDLKYAGEETLLEVGDGTVVRECVTLNRATVEGGVTRIGANCFLMAYTHVAHDCRLGDNVVLANGVALGGHVFVGDYSVVGGLVPVHQFVRIGEHAMIGGGYRVTKDVPPYILAAREPLVFERLNIVGLRRRGLDKRSLSSLDHAYRLLYRSGLNVSQAVERIKDEVERTPFVETLLSFIAESRRGIIAGPKRGESRQRMAA
ncbi:MAG TPA: acyl-ACP--UDP-N-acetylglucosamine O-acyltransferase [Terriglobia bacterium]|nr:acyl-ACP--UDP-N-acetylglucosamine O-acyltransferase [Terriglobia bacterium]